MQKTFDSMAAEQTPKPVNKSLFASFSSEKEDSCLISLSLIKNLTPNQHPPDL